MQVLVPSAGRNLTLMFCLMSASIASWSAVVTSARGYRLTMGNQPRGIVPTRLSRLTRSQCRSRSDLVTRVARVQARNVTCTFPNLFQTRLWEH